MIRRKGMLISVSGMDGSGKSTLTESFVNLMQKRGVDFRRVYGNYEGYVLRPFRTVGRFMFLKNQDINKNYINYYTTKRRAFGKYSFVYWPALSFET